MISPPSSFSAADPSELSVTLRIARTSKNQHLGEKFDEEWHENPGKKTLEQAGKNKDLLCFWGRWLAEQT
jgi:hypothetical protein